MSNPFCLYRLERGTTLNGYWPSDMAASYPPRTYERQQAWLLKNNGSDSRKRPSQETLDIEGSCKRHFREYQSGNTGGFNEV